MLKVSFSDCIGVAGIALAILLVVLDKAGKLKEGWLYALLFIAGVMTLFIAIGNEWVMDSPARWRMWRGLLMFCTVGFAYTGLAIWIAPTKEGQPEELAETGRGTPESSAPKKKPVIPAAPNLPTSTQPIKPHVPPIERTAKFTVMIPFDTTPNAAPIPADENPDDPLRRRYWEFQSLAMNGTIPQAVRETQANGQVSWNATSVSVNEAPAFLGRLLQYDIFHNIDSLQHDAMTVTLGAPSEASAGIEPPDAERYSYEKLSKQLGDNPFFRPFLHRPSGDEMAWKVKASKFPKGMEIKFIKEPPDRDLVRFHRPGYFDADFVVQQFLGTGVGQLPKNFVSKNASMIMQWSFIVTMHYRIEHPDDGEFNPGTYAQWLDALFDGLKKRLASD